MVRILLVLPFITVNWFLLLHYGHHYTLSHPSDNGATLAVAKRATGGNNVVITCFTLLLAMRLVKACGCV